VLRRNHAVHLSPKAFELLELLVASRPQALSKADLQEHLWPQTIVVEANLSNLVAEIRAAIGDDPREARFVRTVHGFGYAFCGGVTDDPAPSSGTIKDTLSWVICGSLRIQLDEGDHLIGRHPASILPIDESHASRHHAVIRVHGEEAVLEDLGSRNGTCVNGRRIGEPWTLREGDEIKVGKVSFTYHVSSFVPTTRGIAPESIAAADGAMATGSSAAAGDQTAVERPPAQPSPGAGGRKPPAE